MRIGIKQAVNGIGLFTAMLMVFIASSGIVLAQEGEAPSASADISFLSKYVWRGFEFSKDSIVVQPSATVGYKGFAMNLWGNLDTDMYGHDNHSQFNETDLTLSYDTSIGPVALGVGYIYYGLDGLDDSQELYISASLDMILAPALTIYREIAHLPSWYVALDIGHSFALPNDMSLDLAGTFSYYHSDDDDFSKADDPTEKYKAFHNGLISVGMTIPFGEYYTVAPLIAYSFPLTDDADNLITAGSFSEDSAFVYGGVTLSFSF